MKSRDEIGFTKAQRRRYKMIEQPRKNKLSILFSFSGNGGMESMMVRLLDELTRKNFETELLAIKLQGRFVQDIPSGIHVVKLPHNHAATNIPHVAHILQNHPPTALLAAKDRAIRAAVHARRLAKSKVRIVGKLGTNMSTTLAKQPALARWIRTKQIKATYKALDALICVSQSVATDATELAELESEKAVVIHEPVLSEELFRESRKAAEHPWLNDRSKPVVLGLGRLSEQKDFSTLIKAFSVLKKTRDLRLVIFGEGQKRDALKKLILQLGLVDDVALPGHTSAPHSALARATIFVLSSLWEGLANVIPEALALGTPIVSTDCPGGLAELRDYGSFGPIVTRGDHIALAHAIAAVLDNPRPTDLFGPTAKLFYKDHVAKQYIKVLGLADC